MTYKDDWKLAVAGHAALRVLHETLRDEVRARWQRAVPFADELFDRWERAAHLGFGDGASVYDACLVLGSVQVGAQTWVGPFTILDGSGGLTIGDHCTISAGAQIYTHDTVARTLTAGRAATEHSAVTIGDCTYVGPNAIITRGVSIGRQCVIGAGALVNGDTPDNSIVFGVPGRIAGRVIVDENRVELVYD